MASQTSARRLRFHLVALPSVPFFDYVADQCCPRRDRIAKAVAGVLDEALTDWEKNRLYHGPPYLVDRLCLQIYDEIERKPYARRRVLGLRKLRSIREDPQGVFVVLYRGTWQLNPYLPAPAPQPEFRRWIKRECCPKRDAAAHIVAMVLDEQLSPAAKEYLQGERVRAITVATDLWWTIATQTHLSDPQRQQLVERELSRLQLSKSRTLDRDASPSPTEQQPSRV